MAVSMPTAQRANYDLSAFDIAPEGRIGNLISAPIDAFYKAKEANSIQAYRTQQRKKLEQEMAQKKADQQSRIDYMNNEARTKYKEGFAGTDEYRQANTAQASPYANNADNVSSAYEQYMSKFNTPYNVENTSKEAVDNYRQTKRFATVDEQVAAQQAETSRNNMVNSGINQENAKTSAYNSETQRLTANANVSNMKKDNTREDTKVANTSTAVGKVVDGIDAGGNPIKTVLDNQGNVISTLKDVPTKQTPTSLANQVKLAERQKKIEVATPLLTAQYLNKYGAKYDTNNQATKQALDMAIDYTDGDVTKAMAMLDKVGGDPLIVANNINTLASKKSPTMQDPKNPKKIIPNPNYSDGSNITIEGKSYPIGSTMQNDGGSEVVISGVDRDGNPTYGRPANYVSAKNGENGAQGAFNRIKAKYGEQFKNADETFGINSNEASKVAHFLIATGLSENDVMKVMSNGSRVKTGFMASLFNEDGTLSKLDDADLGTMNQGTALAVLADLYANNSLTIDENTVGRNGMDNIKIDKSKYDSLKDAVKNYKGLGTTVRPPSQKAWDEDGFTGLWNLYTGSK